jgi:hypothetical protein
MLKHLVHSHHGKLHTFDDFYNNNNNTKSIKSGSSSNYLTSTNYSSSLPTSPCSPNNNSYTFYNVFSDFKSSTTPDVVIEEDETEEDKEINPQESLPRTPVFYLEDDHHNHSQPSSPHWPSLILNRFRHPNHHHHHHHHGMIKQNSVNENQMNITKIRKSELNDSLIPKHRFLKRSETINNTNGLTDKKCLNDDFPELSLPTNNNIVKKHRSFVSLFHHFHHNSPIKNSNKSNSTETLYTENLNSEISRQKFHKQKSCLSNNNEICSPVKKSPSTPILPKLVSLFHRHYLSEHHKYRVGNLKARLHHRRHSPPLTNTAPKFQCQVSNELIQEIKQSEQQNYDDNDYIRLQRSVKPEIMKRVHTWHNTFDLRSLDQCLEY